MMSLVIETFKAFLDYRERLMVNRSGQLYCLVGITKVAFGCFSYLLSRFKNPGDFGEMARSFQEPGSIVQGSLLRIVVIFFSRLILLDRNGALSVHARSTDAIGSVKARVLPVAKV